MWPMTENRRLWAGVSLARYPQRGSIAMNKNVHPVATLFPLLEGKELIALAEDIRWNGLREPIKRWNDMIIDGRNRAKACELANAEPRYEDLTFASEAEVTKYIISLNLRRRHLDTSQRAMIAAKIANVSHDGDRRSDQDANLHLETSRAEAAQLMNVSTRSVASAKEVLDHGDEETIERVRDGKESVHKAAAKIKAARRSTATKRGGKSKMPQAATKMTEGERHTRYLMQLNKQWNMVFACFGNAPLSAQREFLKRVAEDTNATIHFANEEYKPSPVDKHKAARESSEARPDVLN